MKKRMVRKSQPNRDQGERFISFQRNFLADINRPFESWSIMTRTYELVYLSLISDRYVGPNWCLLCKLSSLFWKSWLAYFVIRKLPSLLLTFLLLEGWSLLMVEGSSDVSISSVHICSASVTRVHTFTIYRNLNLPLEDLQVAYNQKQEWLFHNLAVDTKKLFL